MTVTVVGLALQIHIFSLLSLFLSILGSRERRHKIASYYYYSTFVRKHCNHSVLQCNIEIGDIWWAVSHRDMSFNLLVIYSAIYDMTWYNNWCNVTFAAYSGSEISNTIRRLHTACRDSGCGIQTSIFEPLLDPSNYTRPCRSKTSTKTTKFVQWGGAKRNQCAF